MPKPPAYTITPVPKKRYVAGTGCYLRPGFVDAYPHGARRSRVYVTRLHKLRGKTITVFKKAITPSYLGQCIVVLQVSGRVRRYSPRDGKCRASCARVLAIHPLISNDKYHFSSVVDTATTLTEARSYFDRRGFVYRVGETVRPERPFTRDPGDECASGIHFFLTLEEALAYRIR